HRRKIVRLDLAQHDIAIGNGERSLLAVRSWTRIGARRIRPDTQTRTVKMQDRAAAGGYCMDTHHGRAHAYAGYRGFVVAFVNARKMRYIGRCAAHVKTDDFRVAGLLAAARHAYDPACRTRQNGVLATEAMGVREPTRRLHEHQIDTW